MLVLMPSPLYCAVSAIARIQLVSQRAFYRNFLAIYEQYQQFIYIAGLRSHKPIVSSTSACLEGVAMKVLAARSGTCLSTRKADLAKRTRNMPATIRKENEDVRREMYHIQRSRIDSAIDVLIPRLPQP